MGAGGVAYAIIQERDPSRALRWLSARPIDVVVVDARVSTGVSEAEAAAILRVLFPEHSSHSHAVRSRTLVLVDGDAAGARVAWTAGTCRVADALVSPDPEAILDAVDALVSGSARGKIALCLAGGGIEGLLYEVGVLRAIDRSLDGSRLADIDLFCGISAGSILAALLANGMHPDEIADGLRKGTSRLDRITRWDVFDPNLGEFGTRALRMVREVLGRGGARNPLSALYRAIPSAVFAGDRLREYFFKQFNRPGMTDHFEDTRRPLFIGATDQDTSEAVTFGEPGWTDVPIHRAVRASCALSPFYAAETIAGRNYIDGAFTRTTNMRVAVRHGASLVILVDPLVPIRSMRAGYVQDRGGLFATMQGLKAIINGRFDKASTTLGEMYPHTAFHLFRPEGDEMRVLSGSPMKFLYRQEIEELAYEHTLRKIRAALPKLRRDFKLHGLAVRDPARTSVPPVSDPFLDGVLAVA